MTLFMRDQENIEIGREEGGVKTLIDLCREFGLSRADTKAKILEKFPVAEEKAEEYMRENWKRE